VIKMNMIPITIGMLVLYVSANMRNISMLNKPTQAMRVEIIYPI